MEPHGQARGTSMKYPPTPLGAKARFGAQAPRLSPAKELVRRAGRRVIR